MGKDIHLVAPSLFFGNNMKRKYIYVFHHNDSVHKAQLGRKWCPIYAEYSCNYLLQYKYRPPYMPVCKNYIRCRGFMEPFNAKCNGHDFQVIFYVQTTNYRSRSFVRKINILCCPIQQNIRHNISTNSSSYPSWDLHIERVPRDGSSKTQLLH